MIPTFDRPKSLYCTVKSVKAQTIKSKETIIVDNHILSKE